MELKRYKEEITLYDTEGNPKSSWVEIRVDPLTGEVSRVINVPLREWSLPDLEAMARETRASCPFCPEHLENKTPKFAEALLPGGTLGRGGATLIPNLFPYDRYCALIILSKAHYVPLDAWKAREILDGLRLAQDFINRVSAYDTSVNAFALNWNYAPHSGSSILHPHIQLSVGAFASNRGRRMMTAAYDAMLEGKEPMTELLREERSRGERWCGRIGPWNLLFAFAPRGRFFEFILMHEATGCFPLLPEPDLKALSEGIVRGLRFVVTMGLSSMNLSLFSPLREEGIFHPMVSISPRACVGPHQMSDISFQMLIDEFFALFLPEEVASRFRKSREGA